MKGNEMLKIEQDGADCWSVLAAGCNCCEDGWHWMMTSMGQDAEKSATEWMDSLSKILEKDDDCC
jgi:hypothetical protein